MKQPNEQPIEPVQSSKNIWIIVVSVVATALIVGGGVYAWQRSNLKNTEQSLEQQISTLQDQISQLQQAQVNQDQQINQPVAEQNNQPTTQEKATPEPVDEYADWKTLVNSTGGYSFNYPAEWKAAVNQYHNSNSLFGPSANSGSGLGGIEVNNYPGTLESYVTYQEQNTEIKYLSTQNVTINGVKGLKTEYNGFPVSGFSVLLKNDNQIVNIYINDKTSNNVALFNKLVESFVFTR
ncbi:hypothetical protein GF357_02470 [Candidatus Dojkabacteria bacterium]|nr:hypothetical protein [Candidatus Dojkabacteria bacterium]